MLLDRCCRKIEYLRLSVTDRCDLRCRYCMPRGYCGYEASEHRLSLEEMDRLAGIFVGAGVSHIRLTGGEPLLRPRIVELAARLSRHAGLADLSLSTNGTRLATLALALRRAGVSRLNVSLDSLSRERFAAITGRDVLPSVLAGLEAARAAGFRPIKINMVVMADTTDDEIDALVLFCLERGFVLRLIETMPVGEAGRSAGFRDLQPVQQRLRSRFELVDGVVPGGGPARYLVSANGRFQVGFITPISRHFCATCNRVRLAMDGTLYLCVGEEDKVEFRPLLRGGASDADILAALLAGLRAKPDGHNFNGVAQPIVRSMASTGG
jgi:GTP 3',8-cyclase